MLKKIKHIAIISAVGISLAACNGNNEAGNNRDGLTNTANRNTPLITDRNPYQNVTNRDGNRDNFFFTDDTRRNNERDVNISALNTNTNSDRYPHTRAIIIQDAKYDYIKVNDDRRNVRDNTNRTVRRFVHRDGNQLRDRYNVAQQEPKQQQAQQPQQPVPTPAPEQEPAKQQTQQPTAAISEYAQQVINLTNQQRQKNGLKPLQADAQLSNVALKKSQDMQQNNYFSHTSPTYGSPFDMMRDFGVTYKAAGENIAQGQRTPEEVVNAWMNSPGHRANILSTKFTHIGVGHESGGNHWTQMFIGK